MGAASIRFEGGGCAASLCWVAERERKKLQAVTRRKQGRKRKCWFFYFSFLYFGWLRFERGL